MQNRLATRLLSWNLNIDGICSFCQQEMESVQHMYFQCVYSHEIWCTVLAKLRIHSQGMSFSEGVRWAAKKCSRFKTRSAAFLLWRQLIVFDYRETPRCLTINWTLVQLYSSDL